MYLVLHSRSKIGKTNSKNFEVTLKSSEKTQPNIDDLSIYLHSNNQHVQTLHSTIICGDGAQDSLAVSRYSSLKTSGSIYAKYGAILTDVEVSIYNGTENNGTITWEIENKYANSLVSTPS